MKREQSGGLPPEEQQRTGLENAMREPPEWSKRDSGDKGDKKRATEKWYGGKVCRENA